MTPTTPQMDPALLRRRLFQRKVLLPVAGAGLLIVGATVFVGLGLRGAGASLVADLMLTALCLLPALVCLFPLYMALVLAVAVLSRADAFTTRHVRRARTAAQGAAARSERAGLALNRRSIEFNARLAPLDRLFTLFERLAADEAEAALTESRSDPRRDDLTSSPQGVTPHDGRQ
jgi:hypothetical protein